MDKISELGQLLRQKRETMNKSVQSVAKDTKIRESFITKIEDGEFSTMPSYIHSYGFVKQYAEYLGLSYEEIKPMFDAECPKPGADTPMITEHISMEINESNSSRPKGFLVAMIVIILVAGAYYAFRSYKDTATVTPAVINEPVAAAPVIPEPLAEVTPPVKAPEPDNMSANYVNLSEIALANGNGVPAEPIKDNATPPPPPILPPVTQYVVLSFTDTCWVAYTPDNGTTEEFTAIAGTVKRLPFIDFFVLNVGNAASLTVKHGTKTLTDFGAQGTVLRNLRYELKNGAIERVRR